MSNFGHGIHPLRYLLVVIRADASTEVMNVLIDVQTTQGKFNPPPSLSHLHQIDQTRAG
jgi:hypothetical protein